MQTSVLGLLTVSTRSWSPAESDLKSFGESYNMGCASFCSQLIQSQWVYLSNYISSYEIL